MNSLTIACQKGVDVLYAHAYDAQQKMLNLTSTQCKINTLIVLGRFLEVAAAAGTVLALCCTVTLHPLYILWAIPSVFAGFLGVTLVDTPEQTLNAFTLAPPYIPGQPLGLANSGNNCWLNAALQLLKNSPSLQAKAQRFPELATFFGQYQAPTRSLETQSLREYFSRQTQGQITPSYAQHDPAELFEFIFGEGNAVHTLYQQIGGGVPLRRQEPLLQIELERGVAFQELFNRYFDHQIDSGQRMRLSFERAPDDLLIQAKRFNATRDPVTGNHLFNKIADPLNIQQTLSLSVQGQTIPYQCDGFCIHYGPTCSFGHHVAYIKCNNRWWYCSDLSIHAVSEAQAHQAMQQGYIFHFKKT